MFSHYWFWENILEVTESQAVRLHYNFLFGGWMCYRRGMFSLAHGAMLVLELCGTVVLCGALVLYESMEQGHFA